MLSGAERSQLRKKRNGYELEGSLTDFEADAAKRFQSWRDGKQHLPEQDRQALKQARKEGQLHMELLDRREKLKADRYCK